MGIVLEMDPMTLEPNVRPDLEFSLLSAKVDGIFCNDWNEYESYESHVKVCSILLLPFVNVKIVHASPRTVL